MIGVRSGNGCELTRPSKKHEITYVTAWGMTSIGSLLAFSGLNNVLSFFVYSFFCLFFIFPPIVEGLLRAPARPLGKEIIKILLLLLFSERVPWSSRHDVNPETNCLVVDVFVKFVIQRQAFFIRGPVSFRLSRVPFLLINGLRHF